MKFLTLNRKVGFLAVCCLGLIFSSCGKKSDSDNSSSSTTPTSFSALNLQAVSHDGVVILSWDSPGANRFIVKRSSESGKNYTVVDDDAKSPFKDSENLDLDTTYYYIIISMFSDGSQITSPEITAKIERGSSTATLISTSTTTNVVTETSQTTSTHTVIEPAPGAFSLTGRASNAQVLLTWTASNDATSYSVKRGTSSGNYNTTFDNVQSPYTDTSPNNGTVYYYIIVANNTGGTTASNEVSVIPKPAPGAFTLSATNDSEQVVLTWTASTDAETYSLKRGTSSGSYDTIIDDVTSSYTNTGLTNDTTYYYVVISSNQTGELTSNEISITPRLPRAPSSGTPNPPGTCYWMQSFPPWSWAEFNASYFECYQYDSCGGGLSYSGGGCYKWSTSPSDPAVPWLRSDN